MSLQRDIVLSYPYISEIDKYLLNEKTNEMKVFTITRQQNLCERVWDCWLGVIAIWTISWARFSPNCVINFVIHSAFSYINSIKSKQRFSFYYFTLSPIINAWLSIVSSCKTYGKRRENVDGYLSASGDVKRTIIQSETSSNTFSLFNELNK